MKLIRFLYHGIGKVITDMKRNDCYHEEQSFCIMSYIFFKPHLTRYNNILEMF